MRDRHRDVFVNCPFDRQFRPLFDAIVFAVFACGFRPRCARELDDGGVVRIDKIFDIIAQCRFGVHDLSRTRPDRLTRLPRFNMPLELGVFLAAKRFGDKTQQKKCCLILDSEPHRYQKFISDIAGQDVHAHGNDPKTAIGRVRNFLRTSSGDTEILGERIMARRFELFQGEAGKIYKKLGHPPTEVPFADQAHVISEWIRQ